MVDPLVLSTDNYPRLDNTTKHNGAAEYLFALTQLRNESLIHDVPFWMYLHDFGFGQKTSTRPIPDPTEEQIAWQVFVALTSGAKGILYFCYWSPEDYSQGPTFEVYPALAGVNRTTGEYYLTKHYYQVQRINAVVVNFAVFLFEATTTHLVQIGADDDPATKLDGLALEGLTAGGEYLVGQFANVPFRGGTTATAVLLTNWNWRASVSTTVKFAAPIAEVLEVDRTSGVPSPLASATVDLAIGGCRMFIID